MCYTNRQYDNRCRKLAEINDQIAALQEQAEALKTDMKKDMDAAGLEEVLTGTFTIRYKTVVSNRLDTGKIKTELPEIYKRYLKTGTQRRFTVA